LALREIILDEPLSEEQARKIQGMEKPIDLYEKY
jgi:hypothetical protein